jgi:hypothetical protein
MELMDILTAIGIGTLIGFGIIGFYVWYLYQRIRGRVDDMVKQIIQEAEDNMVGLDIEVDKDTYFCYNNEDKQFICQGKTVAEIRQAFQARFPGKTAYLAGGDPRVVEQLKTELLKLAQNETSTSQ